MSKKKKILKVIVIALVCVIILGGIAIAVVLANLDSIAQKGIVEVMEFVLQVDVQLKKVNISLLGGSCTLEGLVIGNPAGFKTKEAFSVDKVDVKVDIKSFKSDEPVVKLVSVKNPRITLEQGFRGSNLTKLIENASRFETKEGEKEKPKAEESQKKIRIDKVIVSGAKVKISAPILQGEGVAVPLPRIEMNDIGGKKEPVTIAQAIKIFFTKIFTETIKSGKGIIPEDLDKLLTESFQGLVKTIGDVPDFAVEGAEEVFGQLKKGGETVKDGVEDAAKGIKGLFKKDD